MRKIRAFFSIFFFILSASLSIPAAKERPEDRFFTHNLIAPADIKKIPAPAESFRRDFLKYLSARYSLNAEDVFTYIKNCLKTQSPERTVLLMDYSGYYSIFTTEEKEEFRNILKTELEKGGIDSGYISFILGHLSLEKGDFGGAEKYYSLLGAVTDFRIIGPFDNKEKTGWSEEYPPETAIDLKAEYEGAKYPVKWRESVTVELDRSVRFTNHFTPDNWVTAYALTYVFSEKDRTVEMRLAADDAVRVWLNDALVLEDETYKAAVLDQHTVRIKLKKGYNKVLLKLLQGTGEWEFLMRFTDDTGKALELKSTAEISPYKKEDNPVALNSFSGTRKILEKMAEEGGIYDRYLLSFFFSLAGLKDDAVREFEESMALAPKSSVLAFETGRAHVNNENLTKGISLYKTAREFSDKNLLALFSIGIYYYNSGLNEKARELFTEMSSKTGYTEVELYLSLIEQREGRTLEAIRLMENLVKNNPSNPHYIFYLARYFDSMGRIEDAESFFNRALSMEKNSRVFYGALLGFYQSRAMYEAFIRGANDFFRFYPNDKGVSFGLADVLTMKKDFSRAEEVINSYSKINLLDFNIPAKTGLIRIEQKKKKEAEDLFEKALLLEPNYIWLRDYIKILNPERARIFKEYARNSDLLMKDFHSQKLPAYPRAEGLVLLDQSIIQLYSDGSTSHRIHRMIKILTEQGKNIYGQAGTYGGSNTKILRAVTVKKDGRELEATSISGNRISYADVDIGDIVDCIYTFDRYQSGWLRNQFYDKFFFQEHNAPVLLSEYVFAYPPEKKYSFMISNDPKKKVLLKEDKPGLRVWRAENTEQIHPESNSPPYELIAALLNISTIPSWEYLARWEGSLINDQLKPDDRIKALAEELTKGAETVAKKTKHIYDFITREIRYLSTGSGIFGRRPFKVSAILSDKFGDCKNKSVLFMALLKELGIATEYILLRTRDSGPLRQEIPVPETNHAIIFVPETGEYLDGTGKYLAYGNIWSHDQLADAINITRPEKGVFPLPLAAAKKNIRNAEDVILVAEDGSFRAAAKTVFTGMLAASARYYYENTGTRMENMEKALAADFPGVGVEKLDFTNLETQDDPVILDYSYSLKKFFETGTDGITLKLSRLSGFTERYTPKTERYYDLHIQYLSENNITQEYRLPEGYAVTKLPRDRNKENEYFSYSIIFSSGPGTLSVKRCSSFTAPVIPLEKYDEMRGIFSSIDAWEREQVQIKKGEIRE